MSKHHRLALIITLCVLAAGVFAVFYTRPQSLTVGPITVDALNPDATGTQAQIEADLIRTHGLFGDGSLTGSVTVDGITYFSNEVWNGGAGGADTGWFFRFWDAITAEHATVADAARLTGDGVVTVWLHDRLMELTRVEGGEVSVFRVALP